MTPSRLTTLARLGSITLRGLSTSAEPWVFKNCLNGVARYSAFARLLSGINAVPRHCRSYSSLPPHTSLQMPALSPTMTQGNIASWNVKEGDEIAAGDILAEIETDKATLPWENQEEGTIAKIVLGAGSKDIPVGTTLAILVEDAEHVGAFKDYSPDSPDSSTASTSTSSSQEASSTESEEEPVAPPKGGGLTRLGPAARRILDNNHLSAEGIVGTGYKGMVTKGDVLQALEKGSLKPKKEKAAEQKQAPETSSKPASAPEPTPAKPSPAKPSFTAPAAPAASGKRRRRRGGEDYVDVPNSQIRKIIARRLLESKATVPHLYVSAEVGVDEVQALRQTLKAQGQQVSVNDFVVRAVALALAEVPAANAYWDAEKEEAVPAPGVDIAIAVATDAGLITPIVAGADKKPLTAIGAEVRELASRARQNKLKPHEFQGGSFSISNLGMYGVDSFCAIINPPQACIMAVGGATQQVTWDERGRPVAHSVMKVTLSADERVYDGQVIADFLSAFKAAMSNPLKLLV